MNSLVGYGVSSDSEEEEEVDSRSADVRDEGGDAAAVKMSRNFLLESDSASSDSEDQDPALSSSPPPPQNRGCSAPSRPILPPPPLDSATPKKLPPPTLSTSADSSVFANPFRAQAEQKLTALQKHVPLTMQARPAQIGGKKVCVSYRKDGRCRFGIKCKFAHDSDLQTAVQSGVSHPAVKSEETLELGQSSQSCQQESSEKEAEQQQVKKRKVGLNNSLIPPKRALKQFSMQRDRERINMS